MGHKKSLTNSTYVIVAIVTNVLIGKYIATEGVTV